MVIKLQPADKGLTREMFHDIFMNFMRNHHGLKPSYILLNPLDEDRFVREVLEKGMDIEFYQLMPISPNTDRKDGAHPSTIVYRNVTFIRSYDVKEGNIIIVGSNDERRSHRQNTG